MDIGDICEFCTESDCERCYLGNPYNEWLSVPDCGEPREVVSGRYPWEPYKTGEHNMDNNIKLYVVIAEEWDAMTEETSGYDILGVADSVEKAKEIIEMEIAGRDEALDDYECHATNDDYIVYRMVKSMKETYYYIESFISNDTPGKWLP